MDITAPMLFHHMKRYFSVDYVYYGYKNQVRTPLFYSTFFETDRHIVLVRASELHECLEKTRHSVVICLDTVDNPSSLKLNTNDLIVLNDSLAENMAFNILNHILESYNLWENKLNDILHNRHSFLDIVNAISELVDLPVSLTDVNFRYIAYSDNSGDYMDFVDSQNQLPIEIANLLTSDPDFKKLEELTDCFLYKTTLVAFYKNVFNKGAYIGRLAAMLPDTPQLHHICEAMALDDRRIHPEFREAFGWEESLEELIDFCRAIFNIASRFVEILYAQAESFENSAAQYQQIHMYLSKIINREYANARELAILLEEQNARPGDQYIVGVLKLHDASSNFYSPTYLCAQIEHHLPGSYAVWISGQIAVLCNLSSSHRRLLSTYEEPPLVANKDSRDKTSGGEAADGKALSGNTHGGKIFGGNAHGGKILGSNTHGGKILGSNTHGGNASGSLSKRAYGYSGSPIFLEKVLHLINQLQVYAGYSRIFVEVNSTSSIYTAYKQAEFALGQGIKKGAAKGQDKITAASRRNRQDMVAKQETTPVPYWSFDQFALDYILIYGTNGLASEKISHPALLRLQEHDREHGTHYLETLKTFVESGYNAAATARLLFIHRSSFLGRMDRIRELVNLDFEDTAERLYLEISLRVYF